MKMQLIAVGQKMPAWVAAGYAEYAKRLPPECSLQLTEIRPAKRSKNIPVDKYLTEESVRILENIPEKNYVIALDERGDLWTTRQLAQQLQDWQMHSKNISLLIGGPDGLAPDCLKKAHQQWSLSRLTLPHPLVRILVAEQLYRAWSLLSGHPYHRESL